MHLQISLFLLLGINLCQGLPEILLRGPETHVSKRILSYVWPFGSSSSTKENRDKGIVEFYLLKQGKKKTKNSKGPHHRIDVTATLYAENAIYGNDDEKIAGYIAVEMGVNYRLKDLRDGAYIEVKTALGLRPYPTQKLTGKKPHYHIHILQEEAAVLYAQKVWVAVAFEVKNKNDKEDPSAWKTKQSDENEIIDRNEIIV